ncbi:MAG: hypothetical protein GY774_39715 [Planctomycetes bacterium]|nr:hypothetical protein [Planctomycetota bacterium]
MKNGIVRFQFIHFVPMLLCPFEPLHQPAKRQGFRQPQNENLRILTYEFISLFLTNKPNSPNVQLNVSIFIKMNYAILTGLTKVKNKPNQSQLKPKQSQFKPNPRKAKNERKYLLYKGI